MADDYVVLGKLYQNNMMERTSNLILSNCIVILLSLF